MIWQTRQPLNHLREKCNWQSNFAKRTGLLIIVRKTQVIYWCQCPYSTPNQHQWKGTSWIALTISLISKPLVVTMVPIKTPRPALPMPEVLSVDFATSGSLRSGFKAALVRLFFWKCWRVKKGDMRKSYLSKICDNYWTNKITNKERHKNSESIKSRTTDCNGLAMS